MSMDISHSACREVTLFSPPRRALSRAMGRLPSAWGTLMFPEVYLVCWRQCPARAEDGQAVLRHGLESRWLESRAWICSFPTWPVTSL